MWIWPRSRGIRRVVAVVAALVATAGLSLTGLAPASATTYNAPQLVPGAPSSPYGGVSFHGVLYLNGGDADGIRRLYAFDGTTFTQLSTTIVDPENLTVYRDALYFFGFDSVDQKYRLYRTDGTTVTATEQWMPDAGNEMVVLGDALILTEQWGDSTYYLIRWTPESGGTLLGTYMYAATLVTFGAKTYFVAIPSLGDDYLMYATDGLLTGLVHPGGFHNPVVWNGYLYLTFDPQNFAMYRMDTSESLAPATWPNVEYAWRYTDAGSALFFTADGTEVSQGLFAYTPNSDGTAVQNLAPVPGTPNRVENLIMWDGTLFLTGDTAMVRTCSVGPETCGISGSLYTYDPATGAWSVVAPTTGNERYFVVYNDSLYFADDDAWYVISKPRLADTGTNTSAPVTLMVTLTAAGITTLLVAGGISVLARRRRVDS